MTQHGCERFVKLGNSSHSLTACRNSCSCIFAAFPTGPSDSTALAETSSLSPVRFIISSMLSRVRVGAIVVVGRDECVGQAARASPSLMTNTHSLGLHLLLLVHQLRLAHLTLREREGQFDLSISLAHLEIERDEQGDEVGSKQ